MPVMRREPYARYETHRETVQNQSRTLDCAWCGQRPKRLFAYHHVPDSGRPSRDTKVFCNVGCRDDYYGER